MNYKHDKLAKFSPYGCNNIDQKGRQSYSDAIVKLKDFLFNLVLKFPEGTTKLIN